jgi:hypothetical protein
MSGNEKSEPEQLAFFMCECCERQYIFSPVEQKISPSFPEGGNDGGLSNIPEYL